MKSKSQSHPPINPYVYPLEYFATQVAFAMKLAPLTNRDLSQCLLDSTALYRRIMDDPAVPEKPPTLFIQAEKLHSFEKITAMLFQKYTSMPYSHYSDTRTTKHRVHFGSFSYKYLADKNVAQLHIHSRTRGPQSDFCTKDIPDRRNDLKQMFHHIRSKYPDAEQVIMGTWILNYNSFQKIFPRKFIEALGPPERLSLRGDSIWGQFMKSDGFCNKERYEEFLRRISKAKDEDTLMTAFPLEVLFGSIDVEVFFKEYGVV